MKNEIFYFTCLLQDNDIALLKLETPIKFSSTIKPICLAKAADDPDSGKVIVTGWGKLGSSKYESHLELINNIDFC